MICAQTPWFCPWLPFQCICPWNISLLLEDNFGPNYFEFGHPSKINDQKIKTIIGIGSSRRGLGLRIKPKKTKRWKLVGSQRTIFKRGARVLLGNVRHVSCQKSSTCSPGCFKLLADADWTYDRKGSKLKQQSHIKRGHLANSSMPLQCLRGEFGNAETCVWI